MTLRSVFAVALAAISVSLAAVACESSEPEAESCPSASCDGFCVDLDVDTDNCGACGAACSADQTCVSGNCLARPIVDAAVEASKDAAASD